MSLYLILLFFLCSFQHAKVISKIADSSQKACQQLAPLVCISIGVLYWRSLQLDSCWHSWNKQSRWLTVYHHAFELLRLSLVILLTQVANLPLFISTCPTSDTRAWSRPMPSFLAKFAQMSSSRPNTSRPLPEKPQRCLWDSCAFQSLRQSSSVCPLSKPTSMIQILMRNLLYFHQHISHGHTKYCEFTGGLWWSIKADRLGSK